jgi:predicted DNA-binding protein (MmcQ/YjbR family)
MTRCEFNKYVAEHYGIEGDHPWLDDDDTAVYRHQTTKKWFAIVMNIPKSKLGICSDDRADVVNLKCENLLIGSVVDNETVFPAYHMNKSHWVTVVLDGSADTELVKHLIGMSYDLTKRNIKAKTQKRDKTL